MPGSPGKKSWAKAGFPEEADLEGWAGSEPAENTRWGKGQESSVWASAVRAGFLDEVRFLDDNIWWLILAGIRHVP